MSGSGAPVGQPSLACLFGVLPASCRQNEPMRHKNVRRRDAGSTLDRHHEAPLNRYRSLPVFHASFSQVPEWRHQQHSLLSLIGAI